MGVSEETEDVVGDENKENKAMIVDFKFWSWFIRLKTIEDKRIPDFLGFTTNMIKLNWYIAYFRGL